MNGNEGAEGEGGRAAWRLIERATNSTEREVDPRLQGRQVRRSVVGGRDPRCRPVPHGPHEETPLPVTITTSRWNSSIPSLTPRKRPFASVQVLKHYRY